MLEDSRRSQIFEFTQVMPQFFVTFRFLRAGEFTTNSSFDPSVDLTPANLQVDSSTNPQSFQVFIKCAKTDPFRHGCFIFLGRGSAPLCPVLALTNYLHLPGPGVGPLFIFQDGRPLSSDAYLLYVHTLVDTILLVAGRIS